VDDQDRDGARRLKRVRSRTSGFSVKAITLAVRRRGHDRAFSREGTPEQQNGRPTSWIHRGIWIVGPERP
jgi:hypothetical protein